MTYLIINRPGEEDILTDKITSRQMETAVVIINILQRKILKDRFRDFNLAQLDTLVAKISSKTTGETDDND